jgi:hypothetical protein
VCVTVNCKVKVMISLCLLIKNYAMKAYGGVDVQIHVFFTSALVGGEWSASQPCGFTPGTYWIGGWVDPIAGIYTSTPHMTSWCSAYLVKHRDNTEL